MNEEKRGAGERTAAVSIGTNSCYSNRNRFEHGIFDKIHGTVLRCRSNYARAYSYAIFPKEISFTLSLSSLFRVSPRSNGKLQRAFVRNAIVIFSSCFSSNNVSTGRETRGDAARLRSSQLNLRREQYRAQITRRRTSHVFAKCRHAFTTRRGYER